MTRPLGLALLAGCSVAAVMWSGRAPSEKFEIPTLDQPVASTLAMQDVQPTGVRGAEFPAGLVWLNTSRPLSLAGLRGKIVLLDFWTYGCINCLHILPDLRKLETKYRRELVVIAVHSAKFAQEGEAANVRDAVLRYGIEHPVVVDKGMRIWDEYAVRAWPTQVLIAPDGKVAGQVAGEGNYAVLDAAIGRLAKTFRENGKLDENPLPLALERAQVAPSALFYPGKIAANGDQIFIADSSHNRLVVSVRDGKNAFAIGSGEAGLRDGDFASAQFFNPQGLFFADGVLYVADTNNHAIRAVDFNAKTVRTLAGTGKQAAFGANGGAARESALSSPWDVCKVGDSLFIAMAGTHQIWRLDLQRGQIEVWAGTGGEARRDGARRDALFAQPSGLASDGKSLFVADSESSCIREINLATDQVSTLAGGDLFDFGDRDGLGDEARLQHPLGLAYHDGFLYFCDTYNSKIKRLEVQNGRVTTFFGGEKQLSEPGGLAFDGARLLIADTGHHAIKTLALGDSTTKTLDFVLAPPRLAEKTDAEAPAPQKAVVLAGNAGASLVFDARLPVGFHLNRAAPQSLKLTIKGRGVTAKAREFRGTRFVLPLRIPLQIASAGGEGSLEIEAFIGYCASGKGAVCKIEKVRRVVPFTIAARGESQIRVDAVLE